MPVLARVYFEFCLGLAMVFCDGGGFVMVVDANSVDANACRMFYTGQMSPFGRPHTLGTTFKKSVAELSQHYHWSTNKIALKHGVSVLVDGKAELARVIKVSRHKKKENKYVTVRNQAGQCYKAKIDQVVPIPVAQEFLQHGETKEWVKNLETQAKFCVLAKVLVPAATPAATPSATPSATTPAAPANAEPPAATPATPSGAPVNSAGNPDDNSAGNGADNAADNAAAVAGPTGDVGAAVGARPSDPSLPGSAMFKPL